MSSVERGEVSLFERKAICRSSFRMETRCYSVAGSTTSRHSAVSRPGEQGVRSCFGNRATRNRRWDVSPDGRFLSYIDQSHGRQLWILPLTGERRPYRFYESGSYQRHGIFSPNGKWIAYTSNETGTFEVYVQPFPGRGEKWKVSARGGAQPVWRGDGQELFYRTVDGKMMAAAVKTADGFESGVPRMLFESSADPMYPNLGIAYAVTPDGQRFLVNAAADDGASPITVITNWTAGLKR